MKKSQWFWNYSKKKERSCRPWKKKLRRWMKTSLHSLTLLKTWNRHWIVGTSNFLRLAYFFPSVILLHVCSFLHFKTILKQQQKDHKSVTDSYVFSLSYTNLHWLHIHTFLIIDLRGHFKEVSRISSLLDSFCVWSFEIKLWFAPKCFSDWSTLPRIQ